MSVKKSNDKENKCLKMKSLLNKNVKAVFLIVRISTTYELENI